LRSGLVRTECPTSRRSRFEWAEPNRACEQGVSRAINNRHLHTNLGDKPGNWAIAPTSDEILSAGVVVWLCLCDALTAAWIACTHHSARPASKATSITIPPSVRVIFVPISKEPPFVSGACAGTGEFIAFLIVGIEPVFNRSRNAGGSLLSVRCTITV